MFNRIHSTKSDQKLGSLLSLLMVFCVLPAAYAQDTQQASEQSPSSPPSIQEINEPPPAQTAIPTPIQTPQPFPTPTQIGSNYTEDRLDAITKKLELLKSLYEQNQRSPDSKQSSEGPQNQVEPELTSPGQTSPETMPPDAAAFNLDADPETGEKELESESLIPPTATSPPELKLQMLNKPADSLELGNSLYWTRNYETAIRAYEKGNDKSRSIEDSMWMNCGSACCLRQLERWDEAEGAFRKITNGPKAVGFIQTYSEWNLTYIDRVRAANLEIQTIEKQIEALTRKEEGAKNE